MKSFQTIPHRDAQSFTSDGIGSGCIRELLNQIFRDVPTAVRRNAAVQIRSSTVPQPQAPRLESSGRNAPTPKSARRAPRGGLKHPQFEGPSPEVAATETAGRKRPLLHWSRHRPFTEKFSSGFWGDSGHRGCESSCGTRGRTQIGVPQHCWGSFCRRILRNFSFIFLPQKGRLGPGSDGRAPQTEPMLPRELRTIAPSIAPCDA